jgi:hypothetical protein
MAYENKLDNVYGLEGVLNIIGNPKIAKRAPRSKDKAPIGTLWVNKVSHTSYVCCGSGSGVTYWSTTALTDPGAVNVGGLLTAVAGLTVTAGGITVTHGDLELINDDLYINLGDLVVTAGDFDVTAGDIEVTAGNIEVVAGYIIMPGPIHIMSGAGVPANGLAVQAGDMYIRTDPAGAASRIYIATAANTWTNVTCAA